MSVGSLKEDETAKAITEKAKAMTEEENTLTEAANTITEAGNTITEAGNTILEFIFFLVLLIIPLILYFTNITVDSNAKMREEVLFRETIQIIKSGDNFWDSISVANRFLSLHNSDGILKISCLAGDCPVAGSRMKVVLQGKKNLFEETLIGRRWG